MIKIAVSSGDPAGIGPDICIKAFGQKKLYDFFPVIFGDKEIPAPLRKVGCKRGDLQPSEKLEIAYQAIVKLRKHQDIAKEFRVSAVRVGNIVSMAKKKPEFIKEIFSK